MITDIFKQIQSGELTRADDIQKAWLDLKDAVDAKVEEIEDIVSEDKKIETLAEMEARVNRKPKLPDFMTGVRTIDENMGGLKQGTLNLIVGQNFAGKSQLALKILSEIAKFHKTMFFSFEMFEDLTVNKLKLLNDTQKKNLLIEGKLNHINSVTHEIRSQSKQGIKFFAIDSLMKLESDKVEQHQQYSEASHKLSKLSQELGVIILLIAQTSEADLRSGRLSIKGSGNVAYDSDVILYLTIGKEDETGKKPRKIFCEKDRHGGREWYAVLPEKEVQLGTTIKEVVYEDKMDMVQI